MAFSQISLSDILTKITDNTGKITDNVEIIKNNLAVIRSDIRILKTRGDNENLGIYTHEVNGQNSLQRAVTMVGVKGNNAIPDVSAEMRNPTSLP